MDSLKMAEAFIAAKDVRESRDLIYDAVRDAVRINRDLLEMERKLLVAEENQSAQKTVAEQQACMRADSTTSTSSTETSKPRLVVVEEQEIPLLEDSSSKNSLGEPEEREREE